MAGHLLASPCDLGGLRLANRLISAPMAGVSDRTFRRLVREAGCALAFPEMVSDKALLFGNERTLRLARPYPGEKPFVVQLLGRDPETLARAARLSYELFQPDGVDINMGCPVPKVVKNGEGAALLKEPSRCAAIVERVRRVLPLSVVVSCKCRLGFTEPTVTEVGRAVADAGAAFITVHGRLRTQSYSSPADWAAVAEVAHALPIPVVGNGDLLNPEVAVRRLDESGCRAVMVGRGALGNPWLFKRALSLALTGEAGPLPGARQRLETALRHLALAAEDKAEREVVLEMRRHGSWYIKGLPGAAAVRAQLMKTATVDEVAGVFRRYLEDLERGGLGEPGRGGDPDEEEAGPRWPTLEE